MVDTERSVPASAPRVTQRTQAAPIYVVSGGTGASGELLVRTVLAQFRNVDAPLTVVNHVLATEQVDRVVAEVVERGGMIVHTMVNPICRAHLMALASRHGIYVVDLTSGLIARLESDLGQVALGQPGLYRRLHSAYFDRVESIEYAVAHDDGKRTEDLSMADIVLIGVSRVGKTPLSMYLSVLGWKTANIPFVLGMPLPPELDNVPRHRVVGLMIEPRRLLSHRQWRQSQQQFPQGSYASRDAVVDELRAANHYFHKQGIPTVDVTEKPMETSASEVVAIVTRQQEEPA